MITTIEFIANELSTTPTELRNHCRSRELVHKRWTTMCFYRLMGYTVHRIAACLDISHVAVLHGLEQADDDMRLKAQQCYEKFTGHKQTKTIRVPDYKTGKTIIKEVEL